MRQAYCPQRARQLRERQRQRWVGDWNAMGTGPRACLGRHKAAARSEQEHTKSKTETRQKTQRRTPQRTHSCSQSPSPESKTNLQLSTAAKSTQATHQHVG